MSCGTRPGPQDFLAVIEIVDEGVERPHPLLDAGRQLAPFSGGEDARNDVEGDEPFGGLVVAIDREGDALAAEDRLGLLQRPLDVLRAQGLEPLLDAGIGLADRAARPTISLKIVAICSPDVALQYDDQFMRMLASKTCCDMPADFLQNGVSAENGIRQLPCAFT